MSQAAPARRFWTALAAWGVATTAFTVAYAEATITPLAGDPTTAGATRLIAYIMGAFAVVGMLGLTMGSALVMSSTLRWIDVETDFSAVLGTLWPAVAIMAAFSMSAAVLIWWNPPAAAVPGAPEDWARLRETITNQFPLRQISLVRPWVRAFAAAVTVATIRHQLRCAWSDAGIGFGSAVAVYLLLSNGLRLFI